MNPLKMVLPGYAASPRNAAEMKQAKVRRIPVVNGSEEVVGILSFGDLLSMLSREFSELVSTTTRDEEYRSQERKIA